MAFRRVETRPLAGPEPLQVSRDTGDTYAGPERPVIDDDMGRLVRALGLGSDAAAGYARRNEADLRKQEEDRRKAMANRIVAASTSSDLEKARNEGKLPYGGDPATAAIYGSAVGSNIGSEYRAGIDKDFGPSGTVSLIDDNGQPLPLDKFIADRTAPYLARIPQGDLHGNEAFRRAVDGTRDTLLNKQREQVAAFTARRNGYVNSTGMDTVFHGVFDLTPEQVGERIGTVYKELKGLPGGSNVKPEDLDDLLMGRAKARMQAGNLTPEGARDILKVIDAPRKRMEDGAPLPALSANPRFADDVTALRSKANTVFGKEWEDGEKNRQVAEATDAFRRGGGDFDFVGDKVLRNPFTGEDKVFKADAIKEEVVTRYAQGIREAARKQFPDYPDKIVNFTATTAMMEKFVDTGRMVPEWRDSLTSAVTSSTNATSLTDPAAIQRLRANVNLYTMLRERNPAYVDKLLDGKTRDFYESYNTFRTMGWDDQTALQGAQRAISPDAAYASTIRSNSAEVVAAAARLGKDGGDTSGPGGWLGGREWFSYGSPSNISGLQTEIARRASLLVKSQGVSSEQAITWAQQSITKEVPSINGLLQFNRSPVLTRGREPLFQEMLDGIFEENKVALNEVGIRGPKEMSVSYQNGIWVVTDTNNMPLYAASKGDGRKLLTFTDGHVLKYEKLKGDAAFGQQSREGPVSQDGGAVKNFFLGLLGRAGEGLTGIR